MIGPVALFNSQYKPFEVTVISQVNECNIKYYLNYLDYVREAVNWS